MDLKQKLLMSPLYDFLGKRSYAQSGEDIIADIELDKKKSGFYVDIGAYHPKLFSNTYLFYKKGWSGICIDPNPKMEEFYKKARPRDVFLNMGVSLQGDSLEGGVLEYYEFEDGATNTFSTQQAKKNEEVGRKLVNKRMVVVMPLKTIFEKYLPTPTADIDLLSIDAEGMDEEILRSNDWKKFRPEVIICEDLEFDVKKWSRSGVAKYLDEVGYKLKDVTTYSLIFRRDGKI